MNNTFAVDFLGTPLSYEDIFLIVVAVLTLVALIIALRLLASAICEYKANKQRLAEQKAILYIGFPKAPLTDEQMARIMGHPTLHQAERLGRCKNEHPHPVKEKKPEDTQEDLFQQ